MTRLRFSPILVPDAFESMYRQIVEPWRRDDALLDSLFRPSLRLMDPSLSQPFNALVRSFSNSLRLGDSILGGMDVNLDVVEKNGSYKVRADLPGMKKEDISVRIDGNVVNIEAKTQDSVQSEDTDGKILFQERYYGSVSRTFTLDRDLDETKATGKYADGVLTLELPKKADAHRPTAKPIAIQ
jgi:HSP20 family protein